MTTKVQKPFKREIEVNGEKYTLTIEPEGFKLVAKGRRKGIELRWESLVNGEAALASALAATMASSGHGASPVRH